MPPKAVKGEYIETVFLPSPLPPNQTSVLTNTPPPQDTGNKVSRKSQIHGTQNIILGGRTVIQADVCIRGDLHKTLAPPSSSTTSAPAQDQKQQQHSNVAVAIGRYTFLSKGSLLRPPSKLHRGLYSYYPLKIGDHVFIGENCFVEAAVVGSNVHIGKGSVIGKFAIIKDCVKVLEGTVVPAGMVVPSWSVVAGRPGRVVGELGDGWGVGEGSEGGDLRELWRSV
ncbi:MAG: hypothetical protein M1830_009286 [Pleopsidium flavum]|nr:MAG: hypothetical protein M1830_009286 [Pleopsidium flavum]